MLLAVVAVAAVLDSPPSITGNCSPTRVHFTGRIASDAAGKVTYTWVRVNQPNSRTFTVDFDKPGSAPVTYDLLLRKSEQGWMMLRVVLPQKVESGKVDFKVKCK